MTSLAVLLALDACLRSTGGRVVGEIPVAFDADDDRTAPLTWGQQRVAALQAALGPAHATLNVRFAERVRAGQTVEAVAAALATAVHRCSSVRTLFRTDATPAFQERRGRGAVALTVVEVAEPDLARATQIADALASEIFAPADLPLRACVVTVDGSPEFLVIATSHLATDFFGAGWLQWHLRGVLARSFGRLYRPPTADVHPVDVQAWEDSPAGRAVGARALARHAHVFDQMPASMLPRRAGTPESPRYRYVELRSPLLTRAVAHLSARHGVTESAVLYGALSLLLGRVGGLSRSHLQVCVANRADPRLGSAVSPLTQDVPTWIDLTEGRFGDLVRRSAGLLLRATTSGRFPPDELAAARRRAEQARGLPLDLSFWFNSRLVRPSPHREPLTSAEAESLAGLTRVEHLGGDPTSTSTMFAYVDRRDDLLLLRLMVDTAYVSRDEAERWLIGIERITRAAALDDAMELHAIAEESGTDRPVRDDDWVLTDHSVVHLPTTTALLRQVTGSSTLRVRVETSPAGSTLVAEAPPGTRLPRSDVALAAISGCKIAALPRTTDLTA